MTCNDMQQAHLILICHSSHHITLKTNPWLPRLLLAVHPSTTHSSSLATLLPSSCHSVLTGKEVRKSNWATLRCLPLSCLAGLSPARPPLHQLQLLHWGMKKEKERKRKADKTRLVGPECHPDLASPCSR